MTMDASLQRIREARAQAGARKPGRQSERTISPEERTLTVHIQGLEKYAKDLHTERVLERLHTERGIPRSPAGQRNVERVLAAGKDHGLPDAPTTERRLAQGLARLLAHAKGLDDEPTAGGAGLRVRILGREEERGRDDGMDLGF
jgi:hypothetical protein